MSKVIKKVHIKSAWPIYGAAGMFLLMALILPIYKFWAILLAGALAAGTYFGLDKFVFPGRDDEVEEIVFTGDKELDALLQQADGILERFEATAQASGDEKVRGNISRIIAASDGIIEEVIQDKGDRGDAYTFFSYYLPTLDKLNTFYNDYALAGKGDNALRSKERIENCLEMVAVSFEKFLDKLYNNEAVAIKASIDVLKTMLRADGLAGKQTSVQADPTYELEAINNNLREEADKEQQLAATSTH